MFVSMEILVIELNIYTQKAWYNTGWRNFQKVFLLVLFVEMLHGLFYIYLYVSGYLTFLERCCIKLYGGH